MAASHLLSLPISTICNFMSFQTGTSTAADVDGLAPSPILMISVHSSSMHFETTTHNLTPDTMAWWQISCLEALMHAKQDTKGPQLLQQVLSWIMRGTTQPSVSAALLQHVVDKYLPFADVR